MPAPDQHGCWNRKPFAEGYYAPNRVYRPDGTFYVVLSFIRHAMSLDCRYDRTHLDPACAGCRWAAAKAPARRADRECND